MPLVSILGAPGIILEWSIFETGGRDVPDVFSLLPPFPYPPSLDLLAYSVVFLVVLMLILLLCTARLFIRARRLRRSLRGLSERLDTIEAAQTRSAMRDVYERHGRPVSPTVAAPRAPPEPN